MVTEMKEIKNTKKAPIILAALTVLLFNTAILAEAAKATKSVKKITIEDRQDQLMSNINQSQQSGELTIKEARKLRSELADLAHKKAKLKTKKNNKLTEDDMTKLESDLNKISVEITSLKLAKRVHPEDKDKDKSKSNSKSAPTSQQKKS